MRVLLLLFTTLFANEAYVISGYCGGRFGDQLVNYLHAKWVSYHYNIPYLYKDNPFFYGLKLTEIELPYTPLPTIPVDLFSDLDLDPHAPVIYDVTYFPALEEEQEVTGLGGFPVQWKDSAFRRFALEAISPIEPIDLLLPPSGRISIAIHLREGGGHDSYEHMKVTDPFKFPPFTFYADALNQVLPHFPNKKFYCHLFTDYTEPEAMVEFIRGRLPPSVDITFGYRTEVNHWTLNIHEDFFSLFHFDVLIRPRSNFSIVPSLLHDYALLCYPEEWSRTGNTFTVTQIGIEKNENLIEELRNK